VAAMCAVALSGVTLDTELGRWTSSSLIKEHWGGHNAASLQSFRSLDHEQVHTWASSKLSRGSGGEKTPGWTEGSRALKSSSTGKTQTRGLV